MDMVGRVKQLTPEQRVWIGSSLIFMLGIELMTLACYAGVLQSFTLGPDSAHNKDI